MVDKDLVEITNKYYKEYVQDNLSTITDVIYKLFLNLNGLMRLYDIHDEYEIYSGNISSMIKGDGMHKKVVKV